MQQLDEVIIESDTDGSSDTDWSWMCIRADGRASATTEMVGAASTQLESRNELIHSDHGYCTTALPLICDDVAVCSKEVVCEVEVCSEEPPTDAESAALPDVCNLDLSVLADPELWDNLEQIIDADQLLAQLERPPSVTTPTAEIPSPQMVNLEPAKQMKNIKTLPVQSNNGFHMHSPLCDSTGDTFSAEPWSSQSPRNDFGASSSGIGSPFSDELMDSEDCGFSWEESFIELFPTLA